MKNTPVDCRHEVSITLSAEIVELVMTQCNEEETPQTQEDWNALIAEIVEEYFNF